jgi:hypothetical protein
MSIAASVVCAEMVGRVMSHEIVHLARSVIVAINGLLILAWSVIVTRSWVKRAALLYAERLLEVLDIRT